jgi:16S rRNA (adenine1518-N6/adenine1519-N6)-dimethyltransferase
VIRKRFGQHFLIDRSALRRIADALELRDTDTVIEIGPGRGALTNLLVDHCARLICVEIDRDLADRLRAHHAANPTVSIITGDVLDVDLGALAGGPYVLVGNVPYYVTSVPSAASFSCSVKWPSGCPLPRAHRRTARSR